MRTTTLKKCTDQSRNSRNSKKKNIQIVGGTSMPNWDQGLELIVSVLDRTHSKKGTREETG